VEGGAERRGGLLLHVRKNVGVHLHRHRHLRMSEAFADDVEPRSLANALRVAQLIPFHVGESGINIQLPQRPELPECGAGALCAGFCHTAMVLHAAVIGWSSLEQVRAQELDHLPDGHSRIARRIEDVEGMCPSG
jgi:hypothetical protein